MSKASEVTFQNRWRPFAPIAEWYRMARVEHSSCSWTFRFSLPSQVFGSWSTKSKGKGESIGLSRCHVIPFGYGSKRPPSVLEWDFVSLTFYFVASHLFFLICILKNLITLFNFLMHRSFSILPFKLVFYGYSLSFSCTCLA